MAKQQQQQTKPFMRKVKESMQNRTGNPIFVCTTLLKILSPGLPTTLLTGRWDWGPEHTRTQQQTMLPLLQSRKHSQQHIISAS